MSLIDIPSNCYLRNDNIHYSLQFKTGCNVIIFGVTKSGKSALLRDLLTDRSKTFFPRHSKILYIYGEEERGGAYDAMKKEFGKDIIFIKDLTEEASNLLHKVSDCFIILDDLISSVFDSLTVQKLFVQGSHHRDLTTIIITQNLYARGKHARTIALNASYYILFDNPRDRTVIKTLERQAFPNEIGYLQSAYTKYVCNVSHGYIVLDFSVKTLDKYRIWGGIRQSEIPFCVINDNL